MHDNVFQWSCMNVLRSLFKGDLFRCWFRKVTLESPGYFTGAYWPPSTTINDSLSIPCSHTHTHNKWKPVYGVFNSYKAATWTLWSNQTTGKKGPNSLSNPCREDIHSKMIPSMIDNLLSVNFEQFFATKVWLLELGADALAVLMQQDEIGNNDKHVSSLKWEPRQSTK